MTNKTNTSVNSEDAPATPEELNTINDIKEECMTKQGGVWYYDEDKAKSFLRAHVAEAVERAYECDGCGGCKGKLRYCISCVSEHTKKSEQQAVEKAMDDYYIRIITAFRDERKVKEVVKERIEKEKKRKGRHGAMITIAPILEYIDALYFAESCARIARFQDARADEKSEEHKPIIAAGSDSNQAKAATNPDREHSGGSSLSISEQQAVEKAMGELRTELCERMIQSTKIKADTTNEVKSNTYRGCQIAFEEAVSIIDARWPNVKKQ